MRALLLLSILFIISCESNNKEFKNEIDPPEKLISFDSLLKKQVLGYQLYLDYKSNAHWEIETSEHFQLLHDWTKKFEEDSIINQLHRYVIDTTFVIHVQAGMTKDLDPSIAKKRIEDIKRVLLGFLGTRIDYNIEIIKVLTSLKYKEKHDIEISINRLMY